MDGWSNHQIHIDSNRDDGSRCLLVDDDFGHFNRCDHRCFDVFPFRKMGVKSLGGMGPSKGQEAQGLYSRKKKMGSISTTFWTVGAFGHLRTDLGSHCIDLGSEISQQRSSDAMVVDLSLCCLVFYFDDS